MSPNSFGSLKCSTGHGKQWAVIATRPSTEPQPATTTGFVFIRPTKCRTRSGSTSGRVVLCMFGLRNCCTSLLLIDCRVIGANLHRWGNCCQTSFRVETHLFKNRTIELLLSGAYVTGQERPVMTFSFKGVLYFYDTELVQYLMLCHAVY